MLGVLLCVVGWRHSLACDSVAGIEVEWVGLGGSWFGLEADVEKRLTANGLDIAMSMVRRVKYNGGSRANMQQKRRVDPQICFVFVVLCWHMCSLLYILPLEFRFGS